MTFPRTPPGQNWGYTNWCYTEVRAHHVADFGDFRTYFGDFCTYLGDFHTYMTSLLLVQGVHVSVFTCIDSESNYSRTSLHVLYTKIHVWTRFWKLRGTRSCIRVHTGCKVQKAYTSLGLSCHNAYTKSHC